jgi:hypothetical protein
MPTNPLPPDTKLRTAAFCVESNGSSPVVNTKHSTSCPARLSAVIADTSSVIVTAISPVEAMAFITSRAAPIEP